MKPKCIGVVGGAGPLAGTFLLERLFTLCGSIYGCHRDADFPKVILISYPFTEMLEGKIDEEKVKEELSGCINQLRKNGAAIIGIACNTVHAFLDKKDEQSDFIHLPNTIAEEVPLSEPPIVLCTSTSMRFGLHKRFFPCVYPDAANQKKVDQIIDDILKGKKKTTILKKLEQVIKDQPVDTVILGCTELSIFYPLLSANNKIVIDPLELMAKKMLRRSFSK